MAPTITSTSSPKAATRAASISRCSGCAGTTSTEAQYSSIVETEPRNMTDMTFVAETRAHGISRPVDRRGLSDRAFLAVSALLFVGCATATILRCTSMSAMGEMPMPGGWTMSMAWLPICGHSGYDAAASFLGMWIPMMVAMMLPSLMPMLWHYRRAVGRTSELRLGLLTSLVGVGYLLVWTLIGVVIFPQGAALTSVAMHLPALASTVPLAVALIVLGAGAFQFTTWKAHHLARCRAAPGRGMPADAATALWHGLRLGLHCGYSCAGLTALLLVGGVMDLRAMAIAT